MSVRLCKMCLEWRWRRCSSFRLSDSCQKLEINSNTDYCVVIVCQSIDDVYDLLKKEVQKELQAVHNKALQGFEKQKILKCFKMVTKSFQNFRCLLWNLFFINDN